MSRAAYTPTLSAISPALGSTAGGETVVLTGTNFQSSITVITIGGTACTSVNVESGTSLTCVTPAGSAGAKDVVVRIANGPPATLASAFTYVASPSISLTTQPATSGVSGDALSPQPVAALSSAVASQTVTASLSTGIGTLTNATAVTNGSGVATFSGLTITGSDTTYRLTFTCPGFASVTAAADTVLTNPSDPTANYEWWPGVSPNDYADSAALLADCGTGNDFASDDKNYLVPTTSGSTENAAARTEWTSNGQVTLDATVGLSPSSKSMKYTWPANCGKDCEIRRNLSLPVRQQELWAEFVVRFSSGWTADGPESGNIDYKFIFGRLDSDRFILKVYTGGSNTYRFGQPPGGEDNFSGSMGSSIADGANHVVRLHFKRSTTSSSADGGVKLMVDGVDKGGSLAVNTTVGGVLCSTIYGLALGANINQGVGASPQTLHWLRVRVWYEGNDPGWGI